MTATENNKNSLEDPFQEKKIINTNNENEAEKNEPDAVDKEVVEEFDKKLRIEDDDSDETIDERIEQDKFEEVDGDPFAHILEEEEDSKALYYILIDAYI